ncbi:metallophosphoesterase family protein [Nocardia mexicana]|uniref:3',5'-cyclic AMP phosphodiesterase CpdA n=1 Tax=Nocardia mexicana TaxID=279262 RepID=A0A370GG77_9NOCA|nr:3',5'-cyclic AMP phosphodiesterase CpdA [Nocardia mexicana]
MGSLLAVSDLHVGHPGNRAVAEAVEPAAPDDWLIVAGDVAEKVADIRWALTLLRSRFERVLWTPGNHELWTTATDPVQLRGDHRYRYLVEMCRDLDVLTPEDDYPVWRGAGGPAVVAPLFVLYDYSFLPRGARDRAEGLAIAEQHRAVATDEYLMHPDPHRDIAQWCADRVHYTETRLAAVDENVPLILVNHYPLVREPTRLLFPQQFSMWCGTERTAQWHRRYRAACVVYGHLHIRRADTFDGVRFEEVSVGYPREWRRHGLPDPLLRRILPPPPPTAPEAGETWLATHLRRAIVATMSAVSTPRPHRSPADGP